jgi:hypothetical protein
MNQYRYINNLSSLWILQSDPSETVSFFLQAMDTLPDLESISAQMTKDTEVETAIQKANDELNLLGSKMNVIPNPALTAPSENSDDTVDELEVSASYPRCKLKLCFHDNGILLSSPKDERITVQPTDVQHVIVFPKREDCPQPPKTNKEGTFIIIPGSYVLFILTPGSVEFRNKKLDQICFQLPQHKSEPITDGGNMTAQQLTKVCIDRFENTIIEHIETCLHLHNRIYRIYNPKYHNIEMIDTYIFKSDDGGAEKTIMNGAMPYIKCYSGVNDGVLYPMEQGLLFFKPPSFIHRSKLHSIAVGRGGGSRYVDIHASTDDGKTQIEFTNIDREEMHVLNSYIHNTLVKAMAKDVAKADELFNGGEVTEVKADPDEQQHDVDHDDEVRRKRPRRAASELSQKVTRKELKTNDGLDDDDEDDSDEYHAGGGNDESEDDEDSDDSDEDMEENESDSEVEGAKDEISGDTESEDGEDDKDE